MKLSDKFIKANDKMCDFDHFVPAPYFRKEFELDFKPQNAEITICGLGFYELYINGTNITKGPLAPYISNPDQLCYYDNYNITNLLTKGKNVIGVILGNGFRNCYGGFVWELDKADCRGPVTLALCLEATDGKKYFELEADETFKTHPSPILYNDMRMGYCYDSNYEIPNWNLSDFDDSKWTNCSYEMSPKGTKTLCTVEPITVTKEVKAVNIKHYDKLSYAYDNIEHHPYPSSFQEPLESTLRDNVYVYDFGFGTAGVTKIKINGKPGQKIVVRHADNTVRGNFSLNSSIFYRKDPIESERYLNYAQADVFICKGGEEEFIPKFKYDGFRYAFIEGLEKNQATEDAVVCLVMNSDIQERGNFECSDDVLNKLQQCTRNSDLSNFYYAPTDCPQREKNFWTGDIWVSAEHMLLNLTVENSLREYLRNLRSAQLDNGSLPGFVPTGNWGYGGIKCGSGPLWDSICVQLTYQLYKYTGNKEIISENVEMILKFLAYYEENRENDGLVHNGLGDWRDPFSSPENNWAPSSPPICTLNISLYDAAIKAAFLFDQLGLSQEKEYAEKYAEVLRNNIRKNLIDLNTMTVIGNCQTSQTLGLRYGLFNEYEVKSAKEKLLEIIHRDKDVNACGHYGLINIYHLLSSMGEYDLAYRMVTSTEPSCYGFWIKEGATTLWESFRDPHSRRCDSRNHHFLGDISSWFIQDIAGIKPNPNADDISYYEISPGFIKYLTYAKAECTLKYGKILVQWKRTGNDICLYVETPDNTYGKILLPTGYVFENFKSECSINGKVSSCFKIISDSKAFSPHTK